MCFSAVAYINKRSTCKVSCWSMHIKFFLLYIYEPHLLKQIVHGVIQWIQCSKGYVKGFKAHQNCTRYVVRIVYFSVCVSTWLRISKIVIDEALIHALACLAHRLLSLVLLAAAAWALSCLCVNGRICIKAISSTVNEQSRVNSYVQYILSLWGNSLTSFVLGVSHFGA